MKKIFALALAAIMTASMATVAFAAPTKDGNITDPSGVMVGFSGADGTSPLTDVYVLDDSRAENVVDSGSVKVLATADFEGGQRVAIPLMVVEEVANTGFNASDDDFAWYTYDIDYKKPVVKADWKVGDADVTVEKVKFDSSVVSPTGLSGKYVWCAIIELPSNKGNKAVDLAGTIQAGTSSTTAKNGNAMKIELSYMPDQTTANLGGTFDGSTALVSGHTGIVEFDKSAGEIDMDFDTTGGNTVATFAVDVSSQGKLNLEWNTTFNKEFGKLYDYANLSFINFEGEPEFNKTGTMYIYAEDDTTYLYEVTDDGAKAIAALPASGATTAQLTAGELNGLKWNEEHEAWEFKTRKLTSYVLSDVELDEKTVTEETSSSTTDGGKDNPDTGR